MAKFQQQNRIKTTCYVCGCKVGYFFGIKSKLGEKYGVKTYKKKIDFVDNLKKKFTKIHCRHFSSRDGGITFAFNGFY